MFGKNNLLDNPGMEPERKYLGAISLQTCSQAKYIKNQLKGRGD